MRCWGVLAMRLDGKGFTGLTGCIGFKGPVYRACRVYRALGFRGLWVELWFLQALQALEAL